MNEQKPPTFQELLMLKDSALNAARDTVNMQAQHTALCIAELKATASWNENQMRAEIEALKAENLSLKNENVELSKGRIQGQTKSVEVAKKESENKSLVD